MAEQKLPPGFQELERFVPEWTLATQKDRRGKRLSSNMEMIREVYRALLPRVEAIATHLALKPIGDFDAAEKSLLLLAFMFMDLAPAVEIFGQPEVRGNTFPYGRFFEADPIDGRAITGE
jgi:hypothetical protein